MKCQAVVLAVDTNVIVRFVTADDDEQFARANRVFEVGNIFIANSVLLETEWVLRRSYRYANDAIATTFRRLAGAPGIQIEDPILLDRSLEWMEQGLDFADAMHLAGCIGCDAFLTFDRDFQKVAASLVTMPIEEP